MLNSSQPLSRTWNCAVYEFGDSANPNDLRRLVSANDADAGIDVT